MVNATDICCRAISIGILMTLSSSVAQTTREKLYIETVYADRVENVYSDRAGKVYTDRFAPSQPSREAYYCDSRGDCRIVPTQPTVPSPQTRENYCDSFGDCLLFPR